MIQLEKSRRVWLIRSNQLWHWICFQIHSFRVMHCRQDPTRTLASEAWHGSLLRPSECQTIAPASEYCRSEVRNLSCVPAQAIQQLPGRKPSVEAVGSTPAMDVFAQLAGELDNEGPLPPAQRGGQSPALHERAHALLLVAHAGALQQCKRGVQMCLPTIHICMHCEATLSSRM